MFSLDFETSSGLGLELPFFLPFIKVECDEV